MFNILLQVLDDGRLTDGQGRTVDFRNTLIILTSNLGSEVLNDSSFEGETPQEIKNQVLDIVKQAFRPEFLNRLDEILIFHRLGREHMKGIVDIQLKRLHKLLEDQKVNLVLEDSAKEWLAEIGYDPTYGARPLKRIIQRNLQNELAGLLLEGKILPGDIVLVKKGKEGDLIFEIKKQDEK